MRFSPLAQTRQARRHYLDVLRGLAALLVVVSHADHSRLLYLGLSSIQKGFVGALGVYLFFILSGYLIWTSAKDLDRPGGMGIYAIHRVTRLVPLYLVNLAFVVWLLPHIESTFLPKISADVVWRHLTFTQALAPDVSRELNPVLWTLTHEALFYLLVPLLLRLPVLAIPALALGALLLDPRINSPVDPFLALFYLFAIGILFAENRWKTGLAAMAVFTAVAFPSAPLWKAALIPTATLMVVAGLSLPAAALWLTRPIALVGVVSFSLYIWHYLLINIIGTQGGLRWLAAATHNLTIHSAVARGILFLALIFLASAVSYWLVERPSMRQLRQLITARVGAGAARSQPA